MDAYHAGISRARRGLAFAGRAGLAGLISLLLSLRSHLAEVGEYLFDGLVLLTAALAYLPRPHLIITWEHGIEVIQQRQLRLEAASAVRKGIEQEQKVRVADGDRLLGLAGARKLKNLRLVGHFSPYLLIK